MLTHIDKNGKAKMVDVTEKDFTYRVAYAGGSVFVGRKILNLIKDNEIKKGDVLNTSKIAGILGAKKVGELIPLCHPLNLTFIDMKFQLDEDNGKVLIFSEAKINAPTGVEMEALTGVNIAALTIYDMCKGVDKSIQIGESYLIKKSGGKSGLFRNKEKIKGKVITFNKDGSVELLGILPEHLEENDILVTRNTEYIVSLKDNKIFFNKEISQGEEVWLK